MTDPDPAGSEPGPEPLAAAKRADVDDDPLAQLMAPLAGVLDMASKAGSAVLEKGAQFLHDPAKAVALAEQGGALAAELAKLAFMREDSATRFKGKPGIAKRVAWASPLPLDEVKVIGKALGSSVNDVLLSSVAGALRAYLVRRGDPVEGVVIRALVPVNLPPLEQAYRLGNTFRLGMLVLPLSVRNHAIQ